MLKDEINKLSAAAQAEYKALTGTIVTELKQGDAFVVGSIKSHLAWLLCFAGGVIFGAVAHML